MHGESRRLRTVRRNDLDSATSCSKSCLTAAVTGTKVEARPI